jgi:F-box domain
LLDLPEELLIHILSYFPFYSLLSYRSISQAFNTLISHSKRLQYSIALETHRVVHNPNCSLSLAERLRLLEAREEAWRSFNLQFMQRIDVPYHSSWVHDINGGIFLLGDTVDRQKVTASDSTQIWGTKAVGCLALQTLGFYTVGHTNTWKSFDPGRDVLNAGLAIEEHDLVALVTTYASLSTTACPY